MFGCGQDEKIKAPVISVNSEMITNVYVLVEKHFKLDYLGGQERFWKTMRNGAHACFLVCYRRYVSPPSA